MKTVKIERKYLSTINIRSQSNILYFSSLHRIYTGLLLKFTEIKLKLKQIENF